jgi:vaccinia related kinase
VHADIKGANILLEYVKDKPAQTYLVDFGLASHYIMGKDYKPDPKKMHNGTIEYTSRDAHNGGKMFKMKCYVFYTVFFSIFQCPQ